MAPLEMSDGLTEIFPVTLLVRPIMVSKGAFDSKENTFRSSPMVKCVFAAHGLHGLGAQGLHGLAAQGLHGFAAHGLHGFAAHGLHGFAAQGLHGFAVSSLAHGLQGFSWWSASDTVPSSVNPRNIVRIKNVKRFMICSPSVAARFVGITISRFLHFISCIEQVLAMQRKKPRPQRKKLI